MIDCGTFTLRKWQAGDKASLMEYASNIKIWNNVRNYFPNPYTKKDADEWLALCKDQVPVINFAIEYQGEAVGGISLIPGKDVYVKSAEIGYWLGEPFWGMGIMTGAVKAISLYAFEKFDFIRLLAAVFENNEGSRRVLEKAGFEFEGVAKKAVIKNGVVMDELRFYLLNPN